VRRKLPPIIEGLGLSVHYIIPAIVAGLALSQSVMAWILSTIFPNYIAQRVAEGLMNTVLVGLVSIFFGTILGASLAFVLRPIYRRSAKVVNVAVKAMLYIGLSIPVYVMLIFGQTVVRGEWALAIIVLSVNLALFISKLILAGFESIRQEQIWAARSVGARGWSLLMEYEIPALWQSCGAAITNEWATTLKLSSLVGVVGIYDIMNVAKNQAQQTYDLRIFWLVIVVYAILTIPIMWTSDSLRAQRG
jgi:ABC-type amino acid transport system permease subunit